jgi:[acyl-carrier-protein] S-malonyltransferase
MEKTAFLFTGQGAQYKNMGLELYEKFDIIKTVFDETGEHLKIDLIDICSDEQKLSKTNNAQTAIFTLSYAICKLLETYDITPQYMAGFSLGEITSLAASKMLTLKDTLDLISIRGNIMQKACEYKSGAMYSIIGADETLVGEICAHVSKTTGYVIPANYNCPNQITISGETEAAEKAAAVFAEKKLRAVKLNVAGAYHSRLMEYDQNELTEFLKTLNFNKPKIKLYSNITGKEFDYENDIKSFMTEYIPKHISHPVKFQNEIENISSDKCDMFIEIGAGRVLSGFVKKTCETAFTNIQDIRSLHSALELFHVKHYL